MRTKQLEIAVNLFGERSDAYHAAIQARDHEKITAIVGSLLSELEANAILLSEKDFALNKSHNRIKEEDSDDEDNDVPSVVTSNPYNGYELQLLHVASAYGFIEIVQYIIENIQQRHQKVNFRGEVTQKPIGHLLDCRDEFGITPLHLATVFKRWMIVDLLLAHGANPLAAAYQDWSWPESGNTIATVLLRHGQPGEPNPQNFNNSWTMLAYIILWTQEEDRGREVALDRLLTVSQHSKPIISDDNDQNERKDAAEKLLMRYLVSNRGANLNRIYIFGKHPNTEFVRWIDVDGNTLLHWAVIYNRIDIATYLLGRGARLGEDNLDFETPPSLAIKKKNLKILKLFFENGLDPNQRYEDTSYSLGDYIIEYLKPVDSDSAKDYEWIAAFVEERLAANVSQVDSIDEITEGVGSLTSKSRLNSDENDSEEASTSRVLVRKHNTGKQRLKKGLDSGSDDLRTLVLRRNSIFAAAALAAANKVAELSQNGALISSIDSTTMPPLPRNERKRLPEQDSEQLAKSIGSENTAAAAKQARLFSSDGVTDNVTEQATAGQALSSQAESVDFDSAKNVQIQNLYG